MVICDGNVDVDDVGPLCFTIRNLAGHVNQDLQLELAELAVSWHSGKDSISQYALVLSTVCLRL